MRRTGRRVPLAEEFGAVLRVFHSHPNLPAAGRGGAVALGNFDGVHHGHRAIFRETRAAAERLGVAAGVVTFEPHPRSVLRPDAPPFRLTTLATKARALADLGLDMMVVVRFDHAFSQQSAAEFVQRVVVDALGARHVVVGEDFRFGRGRTGTPTNLESAGKTAGFGVTILPEVTHTEGDIFSSSNIRHALREGQPEYAARLLGRWWEIEANVLEGDRRGRTIGYPTANLDLGELLHPALGVYAVRVAVTEYVDEPDENLRWLDAVANVGWRPTVGGQDLRLEVHIFDFDGDLYGRTLRARFITHIRPERRFNGLDELKEQIGRDAATARQRLAEAPDAPPSP